MEKVSWTTCVKNEVLHIVKEERNIIRAVKRRKPNWIGYIFPRNCLLEHTIEGRIEMTGRILDNRKEIRRFWKLKEEAQDHTIWRVCFERGYGPVVRQTV
jgi:hypothetical protein